MSKNFLPMMLTMAGSILVYFLGSTVMGWSENISLVVGIVTSFFLSALFAKLKK